MRVWLIGAGKAGTRALRQLQKSEDISVVVSADNDNPQAVQEGIIGKVDHVEIVNSVNVNTLAKRIRPDLILLDSSSMGNLSRVSGGSTLSQGLINEIAVASEYPCLVLI